MTLGIGGSSAKKELENMTSMVSSTDSISKSEYYERIDVAFGFEYAINKSGHLLGKFETNYWLDNNDIFYIPGHSINLVQPNRSSSYTLNLSNTFNSEQIINNIYLAGDANRNNLLIGADAIFKITDYLELKGSLLSFEANINDPSFILNDSFWLNIGLTKYF